MTSYAATDYCALNEIDEKQRRFLGADRRAVVRGAHGPVTRPPIHGTECLCRNCVKERKP